MKKVFIVIPAKEAKKTGVIVLRHILNRGKGAAVKTGIEYAKLDIRLKGN